MGRPGPCASRSSVSRPQRQRRPRLAPADLHTLRGALHHLEAAIDSRKFRSAADVAREVGFCRNRIASLLLLTMLAADIQEDVLRLGPVDGVEPLTERWLTETIARELDWREQRVRWRAAYPTRVLAEVDGALHYRTEVSSR